MQKHKSPTQSSRALAFWLWFQSPIRNCPSPQCCCPRYPRTLGIENNGWGLLITETFCDPLRSLAPTPSGGSVVSTRANSSQSIRWARNAPDWDQRIPIELLSQPFSSSFHRKEGTSREADRPAYRLHHLLAPFGQVRANPSQTSTPPASRPSRSVQSSNFQEPWSELRAAVVACANHRTHVHGLRRSQVCVQVNVDGSRSGWRKPHQILLSSVGIQSARNGAPAVQHSIRA